MNTSLSAALVSNLVLCGFEIYCMARLRTKRDILRYYTYLQNFLTLAVSVLFCLCLGLHLFLGARIPEYISGLRYITGCGLAAAALIYVLFLSPSDANVIKEEDFAGLSPKRANFLLHFFCPVLSLLSFSIFERPLPLSAPLWTALAALPSALYWIVYLILSAAKLWEEPYDFSSGASKGPGKILESLTIILIPVLFVLISILLWEIR